MPNPDSNAYASLLRISGRPVTTEDVTNVIKSHLQMLKERHGEDHLDEVIRDGIAIDYSLKGGVSIQLFGADIIYIDDIAEDGRARIKVFPSTHPEAADVLFEGEIQLDPTAYKGASA